MQRDSLNFIQARPLLQTKQDICIYKTVEQYACQPAEANLLSLGNRHALPIGAAAGVIARLVSSFPELSSLKPKVSDAVGTGFQSDPNENAMLVAISLPPRVIPAEFVSGDRLKSRTCEPLEPWT